MSIVQEFMSIVREIRSILVKIRSILVNWKTVRDVENKGTLHSNRTFISSHLLLALSIKLPRIIKVMPHAVETAGDRTYGS